MREASWILVAGGLTGLGLVLHAGCWSDYDDYYAPLTNPALADAGVPPECMPSEVEGVVADTCGVFVSPSGDDGNAGTKEKPPKTIGAAVGKSATVYACAGPMPYAEAVTVGQPVVLFGALDCSSWTYRASPRTQLVGAADVVPLTITAAAGGSEVHDFVIAAADASKPGGSSIAVLDDHGDLRLENVDVNAGAGAAGVAGMGQVQVTTPASAKGGDGTDDAACNVAGPIAGGAGGKNMCGGIDTAGGAGGDGLAAGAGGTGTEGYPMMTPNNGGSAQTKTAPCNANDPKGALGGVGASGTGARGIGDVSASGYHGPNGVLGTSGTPGQGGGGGGGARQCDMAGMFAGPSGGGGGAGGCPGAPGNGGQSGGSSIGILVLGAKLTLQTVAITTRTGGAGGTGGDGQQGAAGGLGGQPGNGNACSGGKGGQGGNGGPGGGGAGGHSVAVAVNGAAPPYLSSTTIVSGKAGSGGPGGDMDMTAQTKGDDGLACKTLDFTQPASPACVM